MRPELSFEAHSAAIRVDADGRPVVFRYPAVAYQTADGGVIADLGKRHPFAKTPDKFKLHFILSSDDLAALQLRHGKLITYRRCPLKNKE